MEPSPKRICMDLETPSTPSSFSSACEEPPPLPEPRLYHFKILYDQTWDYPAICKDYFMEDRPYLCVLEHVNKPNTHVHFQGWSILAEQTVKNRITRLVAHHHLRKLNPKCRPSSMKARAPDVTGFQYMCKEVKPAYILAMNMFTMEEIEELKAKSVMHCKELKMNVTEFIANLPLEVVKTFQITGISVTSTIIEAVGHYLVHQEELGNITLPPYNRHYTRQSVVEGLRKNPHVPRRFKGNLYVL